MLFLPRSAGPASSRAMATSAVEVVTPENFQVGASELGISAFCCCLTRYSGKQQSDQWEAMVKYQLGAWHGRWDTVSTDGQLISTRKSITGLRRKDAKTYHHVNTYFEEDGTSKDFDFGTHTADKPFRAQLVGPVFVFGPGVRDGMVLGEIG